MADDPDDNVVSLEQFRAARAHDANLDDDELIRRANKQITEWATAGTPTFTAVQELFDESIRAGASPMVRDRITEVIVATFGTELGGRRALVATWGKIAKDFVAEQAQEARENTAQPELTPEQKAALRASLWPAVRELAEAPDLIERVIRQVETMGVVNERELITLTYIAATSRVLDQPVNIITKGASSGGKSFTISTTLELIGRDYVNQLTSSSALSLVYDNRPLSHTVLFMFEATQLQSEKQKDRDSTFAMLVRTLISESRIVHMTTVEDPNSSTGRRVERIVKEGPICFISTATSELYSENETRMLSWNIHEDHAQTAAVMKGLANRAIGVAAASTDLSIWRDLQHWIALGPNDVVIPFAMQIATAIEPLMVRFRRDIGSLFTFVKASALLHQAQRSVDAKGRIIATVADYALAFPIFSRVMAESSGKATPNNVCTIIKLIADRAKLPKQSKEGMRFWRIEDVGPAAEVVISRAEIGIATGIGEWAAYRAVQTAINRGFLVNNEIRPGKPFRLVLKREVDAAAVSLLPHPATINPEGSA